MLNRYTLLAAALFLPLAVSAQVEQVEPNLEIVLPAELNVDINNFTSDYPDPYGDAPDSLSIGVSVFTTVDSLTGETIPLGVVYPDPPGVNGDFALTFTEAGGIDGCGPITNDLTGLIAFIERGTCFFNEKADNAENAGAVGVVIFNQERPDDVAINMSAGDSSRFVGIPTVLIPRFLGLPILTALDNGETVTGFICAYDEATGGGCTTVATEPGPSPAEFALTASPNPSRGATTVRLSLAEAQAVRVEVFNALGQRVAVLHDGTLAAGANHQLTLEGRDLPAGVYLVRATGEGLFAAQQISIVR